MASRPVVFISAVSKELGDYRRRLCAELRRRGLDVWIQEDFRQEGGTLLEKIRACVNRCDAVICLIGDTYGAEPEGAAAEGLPRRSYTQWEFHYAWQRNRQPDDGMPLFVYLKGEADAPAVDEPDDLRQLQTDFVRQVRQLGVDREYIETEDRLVIKVLQQDWNTLKTAVATRAYRPAPPTAARPSPDHLPSADKASPAEKIGRSIWHPARWWLAGIVGLAAIGLAAAVIFKHQSSNQVPEVLQKQVQLKAEHFLQQEPLLFDKPHPERTEIGWMAPATNDGFTLLEKSAVWDLRRWRKVDRNIIGPDGCGVTMYHSMRIRKIAQNDEWHSSPKTSGADLFVRPDNDLPFKIYALQTRAIVGDTEMKERRIVYDVSRVEPGGEFSIHERNTYWNSMQSASDQWVGAIAREPTLELSIMVLFPEDKPWKKYWVMKAKNNVEVRIDPEEFRGNKDHFFIADKKDNRWIYWQVVNPQLGYVYQLRWDW